MLEILMSICSKIVCWLEVTINCVRKVSSMAFENLVSHNFGKYFHNLVVV
jgi:hypothetical protein